MSILITECFIIIGIILGIYVINVVQYSFWVGVGNVFFIEYWGLFFDLILGILFNMIYILSFIFVILILEILYFEIR